MRKCCVPGCGNVHNLHAAPYTKSARWKAWLSICPFFSQYSQKQLEYIKICNVHFLPHHLTETRRLTLDAIPSLNLPNEPKNNTVFLSTNKKYLEINPPFIYGQSHKFKVVEFSSTDRVASVCKSTNEVPPLTSKSTLSISNEPVPELLASFHKEESYSSNPTNNMPLNISCEQSTFSTLTHVVAHKPIHNQPVLEPSVNISQYSQQLNPNGMKPSVGNQMSLDSYQNEKIHNQSVVEPSEEASKSSSTSRTIPSNVQSYFVQGKTTLVKIKNLRCTHSHRDLIPRVRLHKNEDTHHKRKLCQKGSVTRQSALSPRELRMGHRIRKLEHCVRNLHKKLRASRQSERRLREDVSKLNDMIDELVNSGLYC